MRILKSFVEVGHISGSSAIISDPETTDHSGTKTAPPSAKASDGASDTATELYIMMKEAVVAFLEAEPNEEQHHELLSKHNEMLDEHNFLLQKQLNALDEGLRQSQRGEYMLLKKHNELLVEHNKLLKEFNEGRKERNRPKGLILVPE